MIWKLGAKALGYAFENPLGKLIVAAIGFSGLVFAFINDQRTTGAERALNKIHVQEGRANDLADRAAAQSGTGGVQLPGQQAGARQRGVRDPSTRD